MKHKHNRRTLLLFLSIAAIVGAVWLALHAYDRGFTNKWKRYIIEELRKNGIAATIGRLTIDPINGLTARDVRLYDTALPDRPVADIDHISLEVDLGNVVTGENFLRTLDLRKASLRLPVDPANPDGPALRINGLNARLFFKGDQMDIAEAEGVIGGVRVLVRGSMELPQTAKGTPEEMERRRAQRMKQIREIKERRGALRQLVDILEKFESSRPEKAVVDLHVDGPLGDFNALRATLTLRANDLRCGQFVAESVRADAVLGDGELTLRQLEVRDAHGTLNAQAFWSAAKAGSVQFSLDSTIDAAALARGVFSNPWMGEIVFYQPPHLKADGTLFLHEPWTLEHLPLQAVGRLDCRRFTTRGVIFDGLHGDVAVRGGDFHVRNLVLEHHSGSATGKCIRTREEGLRFHLKWNLELNAALPFVPDETARRFMEEFSFGQESFVSIEAVGGGPQMDPATWTGSVQVDLRHFSHRDVAVRSLSTQITLAAGKQVLRDVVLRRSDGTVTIRQLTSNPSEKQIVITQLESTANPFPLLRTLAPRTAEDLADYTFETPPRVVFNADIHSAEPAKTSFEVQVNSTGPAQLRLGGEKKRLASVSGVVQRKDDVITVDLAGRAADAEGYGGVRFDSGADLKFNGSFGVGKRRGTLRSYQLDVSAPQNVSVQLGGKDLPGEALTGTVACEGDRIALQAQGRVVGGALTASVTWPEISRNEDYTAIVRANRVNYARLAKIFDPTRETTGELSGHLNFTGRGSSTESIRGTGAMKISDADVFSIPLLGPLSGLISAILPVEKLLYSRAREATASLAVADGAVSTKNFEAQTLAFRLRVSGVVDIINSRVDLTARMNVRGAPGILLWAVSKLFEYEARGTTAEPGWRPKHLGIPFIGDDEKQPPR